MSVGDYNDVISVFGEAQSVVPIQLWEPRNSEGSRAISSQNLPATDGFTITFYDFNSVSFAYVNQVAKNDPNMSTEEMVASYSRNKAFSDDFRNWTEATYVTGANTRRTTISDVLPSFPVLYGIYGDESKAKGFYASNVKQYVMPREGSYWALTKDGRYFDLLGKVWVSESEVSKAKSEYSDLMSKANSLSFKRYAVDSWQSLNNDFKARPSGCSSSKENSLCVYEPIVLASLSYDMTPQTVVTEINERKHRFLWWTWTTSRTGYVGSFPSEKLPREDKQIMDDEGLYVGCGPASGASLLDWWDNYKSYDLIGENTDENYYSVSSELVDDMKAYNKILFFELPGEQRATNPWDYADGLNKYILRAKLSDKLIAKGHYGWGPLTWRKSLTILKNNFANGAEIPTVGLEFSTRQQHYPVLKGFEADGYGNLWGEMLRPTDRSRINMNNWWVIASGVFWVEEK